MILTDFECLFVHQVQIVRFKMTIIKSNRLNLPVRFMSSNLLLISIGVVLTLLATSNTFKQFLTKSLVEIKSKLNHVDDIQYVSNPGKTGTTKLFNVFEAAKSVMARA